MSADSFVDVTVVMATYNRVALLRETLELMYQLDRTSLKVEWIIIDNNSTDNTAQVIQSYARRLPVTHLFEGRPGKNCALKTALLTAKCGAIVAFTDDDISPSRNWLLEMRAACERWPEVGVFGGKIEVTWPLGRELEASERVKSVCYGLHDLGKAERLYPKGWHPFGGNFWVRGALLNSGLSFDEELGPKPKGRISGGESSFLAQLESQGHRMMYCPGVVVRHRIQKTETSSLAILRRGYSGGRGAARCDGIKNPALFGASPKRWVVTQIVRLAVAALKVLVSACDWSEARRVDRSFASMFSVGWIIESFALVRRRPAKGSAELRVRGTELAESQSGLRFPRGLKTGS